MKMMHALAAPYMWHAGQLVPGMMDAPGKMTSFLNQHATSPVAHNGTGCTPPAGLPPWLSTMDSHLLLG